MPIPLPDCPHCDAANTLKAERSEPRGVRVCECSCCSAIVRVNVGGAIVHVPDLRDVNAVHATGR